jgi:dGTPase
MRPDALAPFAAMDDASQGRAHPESIASEQTPFEVDRERILHCTAFRRLIHKTQVFMTDECDHFRNRLTHTLEVVAFAQRLARGLRANARLAGAIALAHDLGHAPFGHAGEVALGELMRDHGGFEHNVQSLRVVDYLEHPYPAFRGLNLSFELRESLIKHETKYDRPENREIDDPDIRALFALGPGLPLEGQIVNLADAMAYTLHDTEDSLYEGILSEDMLSGSPLWTQAAEHIRGGFPKAPTPAVRRPILDRMSDLLVGDALQESTSRLAAAGIATIEQLRHHPGDLADFSSDMRQNLERHQELLHRIVYRNHRVVRMDSKAKRLIRELFDAYLAEPGLLPERFVSRVGGQGLHRVVCDYIAGMTDRYCQDEHRRLFAPFHFG